MTDEEGPPLARKLWRRAAPLLFWLLVWELLALAVDRRALAAAWTAGDWGGVLEALRYGQELLLPAPLAVAEELLELAAGAELWRTAALSLLRIFGGALAGTILGTALAAATSASPWADRLLSPAVKVVRAAPVASFIVLVLLWVERDLVPVTISALMVLPVIWGSVSKGVAQTDGQLLELARAYRFGRWKTLSLVYVPSVLPYFASGCRTALGLGWKAGVAAEVLCLPAAAIGSQIYFAKIYLETTALFAWTLVVIALSFALEQAVGRLLGRLDRWKGGGPCQSSGD